jgi:hypothetical protein
MTRLQIRGVVAAGLWSTTLAAGAFGAEMPRILNPKFTGSPSCASTSCHGGGAPRNEAVIYGRAPDAHSTAQGALVKSISARIAETLGLGGGLMKAVQCTVCHSPMHAMPVDRLLKDIPPDNGVGCESCHGPAEAWLRSHLRPDVTFAQAVEMGQRNLNDLYGRANACVACHLNLDRKFVEAGHPELFFELDAQCLAQPPHYVDTRPSIGPRSWLTGQAAALRELSWKLADQSDVELVWRWQALVWLLRQTEAGGKALPERGDFAAMKSAADALARSAAGATWSDAEVAGLLDRYVLLAAAFRDAKIDKIEHRRRAEVLALAIQSLCRARKNGSAAQVQATEKALEEIRNRAGEGSRFEPERFAKALEGLRAALAS